MGIQLDLVLDNVDTLEGVQELVDEWVVKYNSRVNRGVKGIPIERYRASEARHPLRKAESSQWLSNAFCHAELRSVSKVGTIQQGNRHFRVPDSLRKEKKIWIYFDPQDLLNSIHVKVNGEVEYLKEDDPEENAGKDRNRGGRTAELKEQAEKKQQKRMSTAEARAETRLKRRMRGTHLFDEDDSEENPEDPGSVDTLNLYDSETGAFPDDASSDKEAALPLFEEVTSENPETEVQSVIDYTTV